jgi:transposase
MIAITPQMHILMATEPIDFRKGIDGLAGYVINILGNDPFNGYVFVFSNTRKTSIKILVYDGQGFWLCQKRLSKGKFKWFPDLTDSKALNFTAQQLQLLIWNGNPNTHTAPLWRKIKN